LKALSWCEGVAGELLIGDQEGKRELERDIERHGRERDLEGAKRTREWTKREGSKREQRENTSEREVNENSARKVQTIP